MDCRVFAFTLRSYFQFGPPFFFCSSRFIRRSVRFLFCFFVIVHGGRVDVGCSFDVAVEGREGGAHIHTHTTYTHWSTSDIHINTPIHPSIHPSNGNGKTHPIFLFCCCVVVVNGRSMVSVHANGVCCCVVDCLLVRAPIFFFFLRSVIDGPLRLSSPPLGSSFLPPFFPFF